MKRSRKDTTIGSSSKSSTCNPAASWSPTASSCTLVLFSIEHVQDMCYRHVRWPDGAVTDHLSQKMLFLTCTTSSYLSCLTHCRTSPPAGARVHQLDLRLAQPHSANVGDYIYKIYLLQLNII